jgi:hypothetical protein
MQRLHSQLSVFWPCAKVGKQEAQVERTLHGLWVCVHLAFYRPRRGTPSSEGGRGGGGKGGGSHELSSHPEDHTLALTVACAPASLRWLPLHTAW